VSSIAIKLNQDIVQSARKVGLIEHRSAPKQLEYWARIGRIAVENPDLPYQFIQAVLLGRTQAEAGELEDYIFGEGE